MKKNKMYLLTAALFMFFAVLTGISTTSVATNGSKVTAGEVTIVLSKTSDIVNSEAESSSLAENGISILYANENVEDSVSAFNAQESVISTEQVSTENQVSSSEIPQNSTNTAEVSSAETVAKVAVSKTVKELIWFNNGNEIFKKLTTAVVIDVQTRKSFTVIRKGGTNHADVEPLSAEDTATMKSIYGGSWSWDRRAIWVLIDGQPYAASMNGMPHGQEIITGNNFNGHFCIHFTNSRTHGTNRVDKRHQAAVKTALQTKP